MYVMNDYTTSIFSYRYLKFSHQSIVRGYLLVIGIISLTLHCSIVRSQSIPSDGVRNTSPNVGRISPGQFNNVRPIRQQNFHPNTSGSQQFFRQDNDRLYFLPEGKSDPILEIHQTVETEGSERESSPKKEVGEIEEE